jgi:hypothetical protein
MNLALVHECCLLGLQSVLVAASRVFRVLWGKYRKHPSVALFRKVPVGTT